MLFNGINKIFKKMESKITIVETTKGPIEKMFNLNEIFRTLGDKFKKCNLAANFVTPFLFYTIYFKLFMIKKPF